MKTVDLKHLVVVEVKVFFTALMFFTRLPCPKWVDHSEEYLNKSSKYFPVMGWIVGGGAALIFTASNYFVPVHIAVILSITGSILITGAFHEDGWADVCDGFGGGWTREKILTIMKDSRVGAFGVIGIVLILLFKYELLCEISPDRLPWVIIAGHALSRLASSSVIYTHEYARENEDSKAKPLAKKMSRGELLFACIAGIIPLFCIQNNWVFLLVIPVWIARALMIRYFKRWIGGYTGDCLGAIQQITEIVFYLFYIVAPWKFI